MGRIQRSITLAKSSWSVLKSERSLALFPVFSAVVSIVVLGVLLAIGWFTLGTETDIHGNESPAANAATFLIVGIGYLALAFVQTYFLSALVAVANERLLGRDANMADGFSKASARISRIFGWSIVLATVSMIMRAIEERAGFLGPIVAGFLGAAFNILTFLAVPIIMFEDLGPINALKRSGTLFKQTWGENLAAQIGMSALGLIVFLPAVLIGVIGVATGVTVIAIACIAVAILIVIIGQVVIAALSGIYRTALYRYAVDGTVPEAFADANLEQAFGPKKRSLLNR